MADFSAIQADPASSAVLDEIHKIIHAIATSDPAIDRATVDKWLMFIGFVAWIIPGGSAILSAAKAIVDAPGGVETLIKIAQVLDSLLPPLPVVVTP